MKHFWEISFFSVWHRITLVVRCVSFVCFAFFSRERRDVAIKVVQGDSTNNSTSIAQATNMSFPSQSLINVRRESLARRARKNERVVESGEQNKLFISFLFFSGSERRRDREGERLSENILFSSFKLTLKRTRCQLNVHSHVPLRVIYFIKCLQISRLN